MTLPPAQTVHAGLLAAFVGFASSFAVVLEGLRGAGASPAEAASGLLAVSLTCGIGAIVLSAVSRIPVALAWSTPGAAVLATTGAVEGGFAAAVGAFLVAAIGFVLAGLWRPLGRAVAAIPTHLANAMLAGVLLGLCLAPMQALAEVPWLALPVILAWVAGGVVHRLAGVPAALLAFAIVTPFAAAADPAAAEATSGALITLPVFVEPVFNIQALLSIAVPLFLVTMASQNIAGNAVIASFGYPTRPGPWFATTGVFSALGAPFGGHAVNLAAITAALCAGPDAHPDPRQRYHAAMFMGVGMIVLGLASGPAIRLANLAPPILIQAVAGLALIGALCGATHAAFAEPDTREASAVTFLFSASGVAIAGISGAFWGLLAGAALGWLKARVAARRQR